LTRAAPPHAPQLGALARRLGRLHYTGDFWYRLHLAAVRALPRWAIGPAILLCVPIFFACAGSVRSALASNLEAVLGPARFPRAPRRALRVLRTLHAFAWCLSERYEALAGLRVASTQFEGLEHWERAASSGRGVLLATAHLGPWEHGSALPASAQGRKLHLVREPELDPRAQAFIDALLRERFGGLYRTHFAREEPGLALELLDALRAGELVALQGDRPRSAGQVHRARVFGRELPMPIGPAALARAAELPLLPVFAYRLGRLRTLLVFGEPIEVRRDGQNRADCAAALDELARAIECAIARAPHQWFCFRALDAWSESAGDPRAVRTLQGVRTRFTPSS
jgi:lauroyl/myristoyl acyltransferase